MAPREQYLLTVIINNTSEKNFQDKWERQFIREFDIESYSEEEISNFRMARIRSYPLIHRYNDICGFVEIYWDGRSNFIKRFFLNGDGRKSYNKGQLIRLRQSSKKFYRVSEEVVSSWYNKNLYDGLKISIDEICEWADSNHCHIDKDYYMDNIKLLNLDKLIKNL